MLIFWGGKLVGANFYAFCNYGHAYNINSAFGNVLSWLKIVAQGCTTKVNALQRTAILGKIDGKVTSNQVIMG